MTKAVVEDIYPLTPLQEGILFHSLHEEGTGIYSVQTRFEFSGRLDERAFADAWTEAKNRHAVFRTTFHWEGVDRPVQVVLPPSEAKIRTLEWSGMDSVRFEWMWERELENDRKEGFRLAEQPPMRLLLIRCGEMRYRFVWTFHHILLDAWSIGTVLEEVFAAYSALCHRSKPELPPVYPYRNFIGWLKSGAAANAQQYWSQAMDGFQETTPLPLAHPSAGEAEFATEKLQLTKEESSEIFGFARARQLTVNTLFQAAWAGVLSRYAGIGDVVFGATVNGRPPQLAGSDRMVGLFINTLPVRVQFDREETALALMARLQREQFAAREFDQTPLVEIIRWSSMPARQPLFNSLLLFENVQQKEILRPGGVGELEFQSMATDERNHYPLTLTVAPEEQIVMLFHYNTAWYGQEAVQLLLSQLRHVVLSAVRQPHLPFSELPLAPEDELRLMMREWNDTKGRLPRKTVRQLFEEQVRKAPDAAAIWFEDQKIDYAQLNRSANRLARQLRDAGVAPGDGVGICLRRTPAIVSAVLAVLKAGAYYIPLDPTYPDERLAYMIEDAKPKAIIASEEDRERVSELSQSIPCVHPSGTEAEPGGPGEDDEPAPSDGTDPLAYVIYTSGSTGKPKGVAIGNRSVVNFLTAMKRRPGITRRDRLLAVTSLSFDISVLELLLPLVSGAAIVLANAEEVMDGYLLLQLIEKRRATMLQATPATWRLLLDSGWSGSPRLVALCGGEALSEALADRLLSRCRAVWNMYGPTETTVWSTVHRVEWGRDKDVYARIGRPILNTSVYVLDESRKPVPIGVPGELFIGGEGIASRYVNRPELTAERFVLDPFVQGEHSAKMYRTGDLVRYHTDGTLEYLRRIDEQVKVHGYRIEPGEVEGALRAMDGIKEAVVLAQTYREDSRRLVAYVIRDSRERSGDSMSDEEADRKMTQSVKGLLRQALPAYMVPSIFVWLDEYPMTLNGKIDRGKLSVILPQEKPAHYVPPVSPEELALEQIWSEVLGRGSIGATDNFFDLGGNSLLIMQVTQRVRRVTGVDVSLRELYESADLADMAVRIAQRRESAAHL